MSETVQNVSSALVGVSVTSSVTVATASLEAINHYAPLIGVCLSVTSITLAVVFFTMNHRRETKKSKIYLRHLRQSLRQEILNEMDKTK